MSRTGWIIAGGVAALATAVAIGLVMVGGEDGAAPPGGDVTPMFAFAAAGAAWDAEPTRSGLVSATSVTAGRITLPAPVPMGFEGDTELADVGGAFALRSTGSIGGAEAKFEWWVPKNNPHTAFAGQWSTTVGALRDAPPTSSIVLPAGELTYVNAAYETVPFAGTEVVIPRIAAGPIVWRSGTDALTLWQWSADRVTIAEAEQGGIRIDFSWWHPHHHAFPADCAAELGALPVTVRASLALWFEAAQPVTKGRLADGATGAAVPVFFDPSALEDPRFSEGAATSASDYLSRARTIALGHSDPGDGRHGNGGLAGTGMGGTVLIPAEYAEENARVDALEAALEDTTVQIAVDSELIPQSCADWAKMLPERVALLGPKTLFDGAFPNLLAPDALALAPAGGPHALVWPTVELTGRRKEVVQQTLSRTYLDRLEKRRGIAVLRIPLIGTRNPLVAAAAESLLAPERQGNWTIDEQFSRALAEIELLAEERHFALTSIEDLSAYLRHVAGVRTVINADGSMQLSNPSDETIRGYTLIVDGAVVPVLGEGAEVSHEVRDVPGGRQQTWVWFDLAPGTTTLRLERPNAPAPAPIEWSVAQP